MTDLWKLSAVEAVTGLKNGDFSPMELIDAALARIEQTDPVLNALPTLCAERARAGAKRLTDRPSDFDRDNPGWLGGLPVAIKDLTNVAGVRTTYGSQVFADHVPRQSDLLVQTLEKRGALVLGKSNTPEFGAGANTFNDVFGKTANPWDTSKTCGGSSGGSAVALAAGQVWLASGSDLGGSLRTPASYCGVVGLRPSPGRVARHPRPLPFSTLWVDGPLGRSVADTALMLDAMVGASIRDPLSLPAPEIGYLTGMENARPPKRIAYSPDLGGAVTVSKAVAVQCEVAAQRFSDCGATVEKASPPFEHAGWIFQTLRAADMAFSLAPLLKRHRKTLKPDLVWNIEKGMELTAADIGRAERARGALYDAVVGFFDQFDVLLCPSAAVPPFPIDQRYVDEIDGTAFDNYVDWLGITYAISLTACPALSLPCGHNEDGLPLGLQMVGRPRGEAELLGYAQFGEELFNGPAQLPVSPA